VSEQALGLTEEREQRGTGDVISGLITMAFGVCVLFYISGFPTMPGGEPGPGLFPGIIAGMLTCLGALLAFRGVLRRRNSPEGNSDIVAAADRKPWNKVGWINAASVLAAIIVYIAVVNFLGFVPTMALITFILAWRLGAKPVFAALAAVCTALGLWLVFQRALLVPLPSGFWS
jgi:putative tricarboxylic transport membrane protein